MFELGGRPVKAPGTQTTLHFPSQLIGNLLLAEWSGDLSQLKEKPLPLVYPNLSLSINSFRAH
jgi:chaperone required for assembly of F1-ATPase